MMRSAAGIDDGVDLDGDIGEVDFLDLGYDSLALLELCSRVEREFATKIPDDAVQEMPTPNAAVAYVNARLAGQA
jgi:act minimal PKS acyl carrier protein